MRNCYLLTLLVITFFTLPACKGIEDAVNQGNGIAFDEHSVATVEIGGRVWMAENLKVTLDPAGNPVDAVAYNFNNSLAERYGRLYTLDQAQAACPPGWRLPTMEDWQALFEALGGIDEAGGRMKTVDYWDAPNVGATNSSGFSALPAGGAGAANQFDGLGYAAHFWSSSVNGGLAPVPSLMNSRADAYILNLERTMKASVRYVRN